MMARVGKRKIGTWSYKQQRELIELAAASQSLEAIANRMGPANSHNSQEGCAVGHFDQTPEGRTMTDGPEKITVGEMRQSGFTGVQIYCADHKRSHVVAVSVEDWPDDIRLSDLEGLFTCSVCGHR